MEAASNDFPTYFAADMQFHRLIERATQNAVVAHITATLIDMLEEAVHEDHGDQLQTSSEVAGTHYEVFDAISRHGTAAAADAMRRHLQFSAELWQTVISISTAMPE